MKVHKSISSKRLFYLIFLNIFLFLVSGFSVYIAIKNSVLKSDFELLRNEKITLRNNLENVELFLIKIRKSQNSIKIGINQSRTRFVQSWYKKQC